MNKHIVGALTGIVLLVGGLLVAAAATPGLLVPPANPGGSGLREGEVADGPLAALVWYGKRGKGEPTKKPRPGHGHPRPVQNRKASLEAATDGTLLAALRAPALGTGERAAMDGSQQQEESRQLLATC